MATMTILVMIFIWGLGFSKLGALEALLGSVEFRSTNCGQVIVLLS